MVPDPPPQPRTLILANARASWGSGTSWIRTPISPACTAFSVELGLRPGPELREKKSGWGSHPTPLTRTPDPLSGPGVGSQAVLAPAIAPSTASAASGARPFLDRQRFTPTSPRQARQMRDSISCASWYAPQIEHRWRPGFRRRFFAIAALQWTARWVTAF